MAFTLASATELMEEIKKSRFLTRAFPINSVAESEAIIETIRKEEATHHCYAWKFHQNYRFNDDGEPTGTAGKPILNAIEGRNCDCVLVIVTRWFGGVKLGTGGLVRAYGGGAARALQKAELVELVDWQILTFHCPFNLLPIVENEVQNFLAQIDNRQFDDSGCEVTLRLPKAQQENFICWIKDISSGKILIDRENSRPDISL
ncbi:YigZ family protein [Bartonella apihabitans]|uniref:IMPACT family protein n=1 Tax=uncultured Bartonella sp. TaxID=104108 RepID=UPI0025EF80F6|nr:YigZ family protein [Bartonella apihabitans]WLT08397.1 YigZ family protein [Bartonella apihabitans]